ncbi:septum formation protein Maf [Methyloversatilis sp. RAC08]|uniref:Maf family protein n=1 Tax=Methyloversatilis sp. RAC08 TaxID=1842540 RepID=UPI00083DF320|nr:Maf family nucleotide pyrophosphatase [Methyloversatilis sp. RAC08]AOF83833.1 septum formation protein Maf [Methyloversatilis sp. RAC08]
MSDTPPPLVLGSSSRYRRELLARLRLPFTTASPDIDESCVGDESPRTQATRLARNKAQAIALRYPDSCIIGSDQVAWCGTRRYGKPGTRDAAIAQLLELSGSKVTFDTALCVIDARSGALHEAVVPTEVVFRTLSKTEIERYVELDDPVDCAGAAKSESLGIALLERLSGDDPTALVGLPLIELSRMLRRIGYQLP